MGDSPEYYRLNKTHKTQISINYYLPQRSIRSIPDFRLNTLSSTPKTLSLGADSGHRDQRQGFSARQARILASNITRSKEQGHNPVWGGDSFRTPTEDSQAQWQMDRHTIEGTTGSERFEREESSAPTTPERALEQKVHTRVIARGHRSTSRPIDGGANHQHYQRHRRTQMHARSRRGKPRLDDLNGDAVDRSSMMASWLEGLVIRRPEHQEVDARSTAEAATQTPSNEQQALAEARALRDVAMMDAQAHHQDRVDRWQRLAQEWQRKAEEAKATGAREAQQLRAEVQRWKQHYAAAELRALEPPQRLMVSPPSPQQPTASPTSSQHAMATAVQRTPPRHGPHAPQQTPPRKPQQVHAPQRELRPRLQPPPPRHVLGQPPPPGTEPLHELFSRMSPSLWAYRQSLLPPSQRLQERRLVEPRPQHPPPPPQQVLGPPPPPEDDDYSSYEDSVVHRGDGGAENSDDGGSDHLDGQDCDSDNCGGGGDCGDNDDDCGDDHDDGDDDDYGNDHDDGDDDDYTSYNSDIDY